MSALLITPVLALIDMPSGSGGKFVLVPTENVYGGVPPVAVIVQPTYDEPCVPAGQVDVAMSSAPPEPPEVTVTFAVEVLEPAEFVAVSV